MKKFLVLISLICFNLLSLPAFADKPVEVFVIDAQTNAVEHNNKGLTYVQEKDYYSAIQEFKMAISLSPKVQAVSVYFNNLGKVYMTIGYPDYALDCFNNAMRQYNLNFEYYQNLVECYKALGQLEAKLEYYKTNESENPLDKVMLGLLYEQAGNKKKAIIVLDEFVMEEPELMITPAVKYHIQQLVAEIS